MNSNIMTVKQMLKCAIHSPKKWHEDYNGSDPSNINNLPNMAPINVYAVDDYPLCPENWLHGSDMAGSYFVGLKEDMALWLDFNGCFDHTHDVAVVLSVQGINPITGQTLIGENSLRMEQYYKKCPIHSVDFKQDYFCEECGFSWPGQNYMSTTGTPFGMFWLDGFRTPDGKVRQYIISADKIRGVAAQMMKNSEDRVFAIGVAFYVSKDRKPEGSKYERPARDLYGGSPSYPSIMSLGMTKSMFARPAVPMSHFNNANQVLYGSIVDTSSSKGTIDASNMSSSLSSAVGSLGEAMNCFYNNSDVADSVDSVDSFEGDDASLALIDNTPNIEFVVPIKKLEVGAGALVNQRVYDDPKHLQKYWEDTPAGMIYINYCDEETLNKILAGGKKATKKDGFMNGIKVG